MSIVGGLFFLGDCDRTQNPSSATQHLAVNPHPRKLCWRQNHPSGQPDFSAFRSWSPTVARLGPARSDRRYRRASPPRQHHRPCHARFFAQLMPGHGTPNAATISAPAKL